MASIHRWQYFKLSVLLIPYAHSILMTIASLPQAQMDLEQQKKIEYKILPTLELSTVRQVSLDLLIRMKYSCVACEQKWMITKEENNHLKISYKGKDHLVIIWMEVHGNQTIKSRKSTGEPSGKIIEVLMTGRARIIKLQLEEFVLALICTDVSWKIMWNFEERQEGWECKRSNISIVLKGEKF